MEVKLGQRPGSDAGRDAVHVAVAAVQAACLLVPGQRVSLNAACKAFPCRPQSAVGVVDPFLQDMVRPDEWFWLLVVPGAATHVRHDWDHPALPSLRAKINPTPVVRPFPPAEPDDGTGDEHVEWCREQDC